MKVRQSFRDAKPCGLVINSESVILGGAPDGKVVFDGGIWHH